MHKDTLDHSILLSLLGESHKPPVGVVVVCLEHALHPARSSLHIVSDTVRQESLDIDTAYSHMDYSYPDVLRK